MNRKQNAARHAARITRELRRLFPDAELQYERECITTKVFRLADFSYVLRVTWERLDTREGTKVRQALEALCSASSDATVVRYSHFDADVEVTDIFGEAEDAEAAEEIEADRRVREAEAAYDASHPELPPYQEAGEVEVLLMPHEILGMLDGTRLGVQEINGRRAYARMITGDEYVAWMHREEARSAAEGRHFPEQPQGWEADMRRKLTPLPTEMVNQLLNPTRRSF
jgi:hypothetical protein